MDSKYLRFEEVTELSKNKKTKDFRVWNQSNNNFVGFINWYGPWRRYVFSTPKQEMVYDTNCLKDIARFIDELMEARVNKLVEMIKNS